MAAALPFPAFAGPCADAAANAADIDWLVAQLARHYAYLAQAHIDLKRLREIYAAQARDACGPHDFLGVLERCLAELHDHHIEPGVNNDASPFLVPTGAEAWAAFVDGRARIEAVRPGSSLEAAGVRAGDEVTAIGGVPVNDAVAAQAPRALRTPDPEARNYTLRTLLAGRRNAPRDFAIAGKHIALPPHQDPPDGPPLTLHRHDAIARIRVENSLGDDALVAAFDQALIDAHGARGLILDLRNTPSGGNTDVAEPILGRFLHGKHGYQRVFDPGPGKHFPKDGWTRWVNGRGKTVTLPLVVLCDRWTGSMGEGVTIALDGLKRATVVGTRMAGLRGSTKDFALPNSKIVARFPVERLYHLNATPRELWKPPVLVDLARESGDDPVLARGLAVLRKKIAAP